MIHPLSDVQTKQIGENTTVWQYAIILGGAQIGRNCNINCHTFIENDVVLGNNVTLKSGVYLWDGIEIKNNVFIGPNVTFTNDLRPRSKIFPSRFQKIIIEDFVSIGAGSIILGGVKIGEYSMIGAGALVTRNVPSRALAIGSPARVVAWLNDDGTKMIERESYFIDNKGGNWILLNNELTKMV